MKRIGKLIVESLNYGSITKEEFREIKEEIQEKNRSSLCVISLCLVLMFAGLITGSLFFEMMEQNRELYIVTGALFLCVYLFCLLMKRYGKKYIMLLWYLAMSLMFTYALILNNVIRNDISATTFCLIMIVVPLLIIERPWRIFLYYLILIAIFIPVEFYYKAYTIAFADIINVLCCVFLGCVVHTQIIRVKIREILQRRHIEQERATDKLTGCLTKAAFERQMEERMKAGEGCGVLFVMDLDAFKSINDTYGHVFGDMILRTFGSYIRADFSEKGFCGRFGGDEFQIWMPGSFNRSDLAEQLDKLLNAVRGIVTPDDRIKVGISIGVALCPEHGETYEEVFKNADAALYSAKALGKNRYVFCPEERIRRKA